jgi:ribonuclease P protein component
VITLSVLRKRAEFLVVAEQGRKWVAPALILQKGAPHPKDASEKISSIRYGLTASGKIGNAVTRNRARRRMRALAEALLPVHAVPGHDYVLIARATTPGRDFTALEQDLLMALKKLGAYHEKNA